MLVSIWKILRNFVFHFQTNSGNYTHVDIKKKNTKLNIYFFLKYNFQCQNEKKWAFLSFKFKSKLSLNLIDNLYSGKHMYEERCYFLTFLTMQSIEKFLNQF